MKRLVVTIALVGAAAAVAPLRAHKPVTSKYTLFRRRVPDRERALRRLPCRRRHRPDVVADVQRREAVGGIDPSGAHGRPHAAVVRRSGCRAAARRPQTVAARSRRRADLGHRRHPSRPADEDCAGDSAPLVAERPAGSRSADARSGDVGVEQERGHAGVRAPRRQRSRSNGRGRRSAAGQSIDRARRDHFLRRPGAAEPAAVFNVWLPGSAPAAPAAGFAFPWHAHDQLVVRIHYKKNWKLENKPASDRSAVGLYLTKSTAREIHGVDISGGDALGAPLQALAIRVAGGNSDAPVRVDAIRPDGTRLTIAGFVARAGWDQRYWLARPIDLPKGSRIDVRRAVAMNVRVWLDASTM